MRAQAASAATSVVVVGQRIERIDQALEALREGRFAQQILGGKEGVEGGPALAGISQRVRRALVQSGGFGAAGRPRAR